MLRRVVFSLWVILAIAMSGCKITLPDLPATVLGNVKSPPRSDMTPAWSPDGKQIAFQSFESDPRAFYGIYCHVEVINADGSNFQRLTPGTSYNYCSGPHWSPDGRQIVFSASPDYYSEIYVIGMDGDRPKQLTHCRDEERSCNRPIWSPDGQRIAFGSYYSRTAHSEIRLMNTNDLYFISLPICTSVWDFAWSPDGQKVACQHDNGSSDEIGTYIMGVDGSNSIRLTGQKGGGLTWSPDGKSLAFYNSGIRVVEIDSSHVISLTQPLKVDSGDYYPVWSPDSQQLAFYRNGICLINADGSNLVQLTTSSVYEEVAWSPDGQKIAFYDFDHGGIATMGVDGTDFRPMLTAEFIGTPLSGTAPLSVTFTSHWAGAVSYLWSFGDGVTSTLQNPAHIYKMPGMYTVNLVVEAPGGKPGYAGPGGKYTKTKPSYIEVLP